MRHLPVAAALLLLCLALAVPAFPADTPAAPPAKPAPKSTPPKLGNDRIFVDSAYIEGTPSGVTLKKDAIDSTLATIADGSLALDKRIGAIGLAGLVKLNDAVPPLIALLKRSDDINVKVAAVWALREIGDPSAIPVLLLVQADAIGPNPRLRYDKDIEFPDLGVKMTFLELVEDAIGSLGETVAGQYAKILAASAGNYRSPSSSIADTQRSALAVLVCIGDRDYRAVTALINVLKSPEGSYPPDFRETAALGLARVLATRVKAFAAVRARDPIADEITEMLVDYVVRTEPGSTREYITSALSIACPVDTVTLLTRHFADNSPDPVRLRTIEILGMLRSRESVEALTWALENEKNPELRWRAAFGLGLAGRSDASIKALAKVINDPAHDVRLNAIIALGKVGGSRAIALVAPAVKDPDQRVRTAAARALGLAADKAALPLLLLAAADKEVMVRSTALAGLAALPNRDSLLAIAHAAQDENREVRFTAGRILASIHAPAAYAALLRLSIDSDRAIRTDAIQALRIAAANDPADLKPALIFVMTDTTNPASADACDYADFPGDKDIAEALKKASLDKRPAVRAAALRALEKSGKQ